MAPSMYDGLNQHNVRFDSEEYGVGKTSQQCSSRLATYDAEA
jgi:hypothetical protein